MGSSVWILGTLLYVSTCAWLHACVFIVGLPYARAVACLRIRVCVFVYACFRRPYVQECSCVALWPGDAVLCIESMPGSLPVSHSVVSSSSQQQASSQPLSLLNYEMHISSLCCLYLIIFHSFDKCFKWRKRKKKMNFRVKVGCFSAVVSVVLGLVRVAKMS